MPTLFSSAKKPIINTILADAEKRPLFALAVLTNAARNNHKSPYELLRRGLTS